MLFSEIFLINHEEALLKDNSKIELSKTSLDSKSPNRQFDNKG